MAKALRECRKRLAHRTFCKCPLMHLKSLLAHRIMQERFTTTHLITTPPTLLGNYGNSVNNNKQP